MGGWQNGGPWSFDNAMLLVDVIPTVMEPVNVPLYFIDIWIQRHDLPTGFMSEAMGKQLRNFFGEFLLYDAKGNTNLWKEHMRVKIRLDVRNPMKHKKKITRKNDTEFAVTCKYERLGEFYFVCGLLLQSERFCRKNLDKRGTEEVKE